jgi:methylated-DNA-[protein]-cysteine S-methyltransferase
MNHPRSARAVGGACRRNPVPLFIPCHRVIASNRSLRGYSAGGIAIKQILLDHEARADGERMTENG